MWCTSDPPSPLVQPSIHVWHESRATEIVVPPSSTADVEAFPETRDSENEAFALADLPRVRTSSPDVPPPTTPVDIERIAAAASRWHAANPAGAFFDSALCVQEHLRWCYPDSGGHTVPEAQDDATEDEVTHDDEVDLVTAPAAPSGRSSSQMVEKTSLKANGSAQDSLLLDPHQTSLYAAASLPGTSWSGSGTSVTAPSTDHETTAYGEAALRRFFSEAIQQCYHQEDALHKAVADAEARLVREGVRALAVPTLALTHKPGRRTRSLPAIDVFNCDLPPSASAVLTPPVGVASSPLLAACADQISTTPIDSGVATLPLRKNIKRLMMAHLRSRVEADTASQHARDRNRLQELPYLVEDVVRYCGTLYALRHASNSHAVEDGSGHQAGITVPTPPCEEGDDTIPPTSSMVSSGGGGCPSHPYGDPSQLLYQRYPAPLFRSTSFAMETIRLLKWLRTWRGREPPTPNPCPTAVVTPSPPHDEATKTISETNVSQQVSNSEAQASGRHAARITAHPQGNGTPGSPAPCQVAFLKLFGMTAKASREDADPTPRATDAKRHKTEKDESSRATTGAIRNSFPAHTVAGGTITVPNAFSPLPPTHPTSQLVVEVDPTTAEVDAHTTTRTRHSLGQRAYEKYCQEWCNAVQGPFHGNAPPPMPPTAVPSPPTTASARVKAGCPVFQGLAKEPLLATGGVYCDAHGNRLRSVRLAKKDADRRALAAENRRKRATKRGYFDRAEDRTNCGSTDVLAADAAWACESRRLGEDRYRPHSRVPSSDSDDDQTAEDLTNIAVVCGPTGSGKTAAVYLAAQLLGFRVIEMNASVRRCPKTVERLLAELTRSHRLSGLRHSRAVVSIEEELLKLKRDNGAHVAKMLAGREASASAKAAKEVDERCRATRKAKKNVISADAVAAFFAPKKKANLGHADVKGPTATTVADDASAESATESPIPPVVIGNEEDSPDAAAPTATPHTLLLLEDADVLLGDESLKPFYAAIRDLALESKVPLVVTVSSPPATEPSALKGVRPFHYAHPSDTTLHHGAYHTDPHTLMEETDRCLGVEPDPLGAAASTVGSSNTGGSAGGAFPSAAVAAESAGSCVQVAMSATLASQYFGRRTPFTSLEPISRVALHAQLLAVAAVELGLVTARPSVAAAAPPPSLGAAAALCSAAPASHVDGACGVFNGEKAGGILEADILNGGVQASQSFRGGEAHKMDPAPRLPHRRRKGTGEANHPSHLCLGLEVDHTRRPVHLSDESSRSLFAGGLSTAAATPSNYTSNTASSPVPPKPWELGLRHPDRFIRLAAWLRRELFGPPASSLASLPSLAEAQSVAAGTTDVRYWLNRLHLALIQPKPMLEALCEEEGDGSKSRKHPMRKTTTVSAEAASAYDVQYGRYSGCLCDNSAHSPQYLRWQEEVMLDYTQDVLDELDTLDHPTSRISYSEPTAPPKKTSKCGKVQSKSKTTATPASPPSPLDPPAPTRSSGRLSDFFSPTATSSTAVIDSCQLSISPSSPTVSVDGTGSPHPLQLRTPWRALVDTHTPQPVGLVLPYGNRLRWLLALDRDDHGLEQGSVPGSLPVGTPSAERSISASSSSERLACFRAWWRRAKKAEAARRLVGGTGQGTYEDIIGFQSLLEPSPNTAATPHVVNSV